MSDLNAVIDDALRRIIGIIIPAVETAIRADERAKTAERVARAIEVAQGERCPECRGKAASRTVNGTQVIRRGGCGHIWRHRERPWLDYDAAAIARQHANGMPSAAVEGRTGADAKGGMPESAEGATARFGTPDTNKPHEERA